MVFNWSFYRGHCGVTVALVSNVERSHVPRPSVPDAVQRHRQDADVHSATDPLTSPRVPLAHLCEDWAFRVIFDLGVTGNDGP